MDTSCHIAGGTSSLRFAAGASDMLVECLGDRGKHARTCIGAGSCPAAVTVEMIVRVKD